MTHGCKCLCQMKRKLKRDHYRFLYMKKEFLGKTKNGIDVYVDMEHSHASTHFAHHPKLREAVEEVIPMIDADDSIVRLDRDMGREIGTTDLVETGERDEIVYAKRPLRTTFSRFVKHKQPTPTNWITIALRKNGDEYSLYTAFVGKATPSFPGGDYLPEQSKEFWGNHALVWGSQEIIHGSETSTCPW